MTTKTLKHKDSSPERFAFIHALRAYAALLVVWAHLSGFWLYSRGKGSTLQVVWTKWIANPFHLLYDGGHLAVVIFFLVSGFIITHASRKESNIEFAIKRTMRIFPPLFAAIGVTWILYRIALLMHTNLPGIQGGGALHWLSSMFLLDGYLGPARALNVTWTLVIEVAFYILVLLFLRTSKANPLRAQWQMTVVWVVVAVTSINLLGAGALNADLMTYIAFLLLGRLIYMHHQKLLSMSDVLLNGAVISLLFCMLTEFVSPGSLLAPGGWAGHEPIVNYIMAILIFLMMLRLSQKTMPRFIKFVGDTSYSLYLFHLPIGLTALNLLSRTGLSASLSTILAIGVAVATAWIPYRLVERPSQELARKLITKLREQPEYSLYDALLLKLRLRTPTLETVAPEEAL